MKRKRQDHTNGKTHARAHQRHDPIKSREQDGNERDEDDDASPDPDSDEAARIPSHSCEAFGRWERVLFEAEGFFDGRDDRSDAVPS